MQELASEFELLVPAKSLLGRELKVLQRERDKQEALFDLAINKMSYETSPYRRSIMAIQRFLEEWLPRVRKANLVLADQVSDRLALREASLLDYEFGTKTPLDRRSECSVWMHYALSKYRIMRPAIKRAKMYHPGLVLEVVSALKTFRKELRLWKYSRTPFDGSQAMSSMFQLFLKLDLLGAVND